MGGAGTNANVFVVLFGEHGDSGEIRLRDSETNRDPFETGRTDVFTAANVLDLGRLVKLRVWHDNKGTLTFLTHDAENRARDTPLPGRIKATLRNNLRQVKLFTPMCLCHQAV